MGNTGNEFQGVLEKIKMKDVMQSPVVCIYDDDEVSKVQEVFVANNIYYLPVVSHARHLVGLVSRKYFYKMQSPRRTLEQYDGTVQCNPDLIFDGDSFYSKHTLNSYILRNMMQKDPLALQETDSVRTAIQRMEEKNAGCIVIIDNDRHVCGIFSSQEIIRFLSNL